MSTHALFSDDVIVPFLGSVAVDKQYRFDIGQRDVLAGGGIHTPVITATPTLRAIVINVFGGLDASAPRELPAGHVEVSTIVIPVSKKAWVERVQERLGEEVCGGGRAYVVCPRIEDDDEGLPLTSVADVSTGLREKNALTGIGVGTIYGRMSFDEKAEAMGSFVSGHVLILVLTTAVEVGVDVPEATAAMTLDADRLGPSQLYQLRGRIGRGTAFSVYLVVTSAGKGSLAFRRLEVFVSTTDGFTLVELDLQLRGEGDVLGAVQVGQGSHLRFLSVAKGRKIIEMARAIIHGAVVTDPEFVGRRTLIEVVAAIDAERVDHFERG